MPDVLQPATAAMLDDGERDRAARFADARRGAWHGGTRALAKKVVAHRLGGSAPDVRFGTRACPGCGSVDHGPPMIVSPRAGLTVSWSRAGPMAAVAIGDVTRLGVDVECANRMVDVAMLATCVLSPAEHAALEDAGDEAARRSLFFRCWTRKEAVLKAAGVGIATDLRVIDVHPAEEEAVVDGPRDLEPTSWLVRTLDINSVAGWPGERLEAAVAWPSAAGPVESEVRSFAEFASEDPGTPSDGGAEIPVGPPAHRRGGAS